MHQTPARFYPAHLQTLIRRYDQALEASGYDTVAIAAGSPQRIFLDDMDYPFKANPHFKHWLPVTDNPHSFVIYTPGEKPVLLFYRPVDFWHKPPDEPRDFWVEHFDIRYLAQPEDARGHLPRNMARCAFIGEPEEIHAGWGVQHLNPPKLLDFLHYHRAVKTDYELACMREASMLGVRAHRAAAAAFRAGGSEFDIHLAYLAACRHNEHQLPYSNIIALNENGSVLHYQHQSRNAPPEKFSFLIDAGATFNGYASDITRTYAYRDGEFQELIEAVDAAQQQLCAQVRPSLDYRQLQSATHRHVAQILHDFEFVRLDVDALLETGITRTFFPHGVGHFIGLQVHDVGGFMADATGKTIAKPGGQPFLRLTRKVDENQVFTIEPGIYFIEPLLADLQQSAQAKHVNWKKVDAFRKYGGVRIEDNVVVTAAGHENLTRKAFAETD